LGYVCLSKQVLAEDFAAFQLSRHLAGTKNPQPFFLKGIDNPQGQRCFGTHHGQTDLLLFG
jgi:hypothetical protein